MDVASRRLLLLAAALAVSGCDLSRGGEEAAVDAGTDALPPPRTDLVPAVGSDDTIELAAWNIEWFPKSDRTVSMAADVIASLDLDIVVLEEVASVAAWDDLVARLPDHAGILSSHRYTATSYQKIGVLYREDLMTASAGELLFITDTYAFPRPALRVHFELDNGLGLDVIGIHLKAGGEASDHSRRIAAIRDLDGFLRTQIDAGGEDEVVVLGDYNARLDDTDDAFAPLRDAPDRYTIRTTALAAADTPSFIPSSVLIDHIVTTAGLAAEIGAADAIIPDLHLQVPRYDADLSDHLPVILVFPR